MSKVIQITESAMAGTPSICGPSWSLTALCDDGTMWSHVFPRKLGETGSWIQLPPIPQDTPTPHAGGTDAEVGHG